jgi:hypothetical protein
MNDRLRVDGARPFDDPDTPPWWEEGVTVAVDEATYVKHLELLPPRFMRGTMFAFGEGAGNFTLFWQQGQQYFAHPLSLDDTLAFCRLSGTSLHDEATSPGGSAIVFGR